MKTNTINISKKQLEKLNETIEQMLYDYRQILREVKANISILTAAKKELDDCLINPKKYYENIVYMWHDLLYDCYYIGSTGNEQGRIQAHKCSVGDKFHRRLFEHPDEFEYKVVSRHATRKEAYEAEAKLIKEYVKNGYKLYNKTI